MEMELNEMIRNKFIDLPEFKELPEDDYFLKLYNMFVEDIEDHIHYKILVMNEFGVYFVNYFPGLDTIFVLEDDCHVMDIGPLEDRICNEKFVMFVPQESNGMYHVISSIRELMGEVVKVYSIYGGNNSLYSEEDLIDIRYRRSCPFIVVTDGVRCTGGIDKTPEKDCKECRVWTQNWKNFVYKRMNGMIEWMCKHGIGHPDPDVVRIHENIKGGKGYGVHCCDMCCQRNDFPGRMRSDDDYWISCDSYEV